MEPFRKCSSSEDIPDLSGRVIVVTGRRRGWNRQRNARVYVASRSMTKWRKLLEDLSILEINKSTLRFLELDLSDIKNCIRAAKQFEQLETRVDVVIANAALSVMPQTLTTDGLEIQLGTNHLGHFVFIYSLLDLIKETSKNVGDARIVVVASHAHAMYKPIPGSIIDFDGLGVEGPDRLRSVADVQASLQRYARSKLANILFARALDKHFQETGHSNVFVNCLNPGTVGTSVSSDSAVIPPWMALFSWAAVRLTGISVQDGARTTLLLATDAEIKTQRLSGRYFDVGPLSGKFWYGYSWDATDTKLSDAAANENLMITLWK